LNVHKPTLIICVVPGFTYIPSIQYKVYGCEHFIITVIKTGCIYF